MIERQKRLHEVYEYVRENFGIHTQTEFAKAVRYSRIYISAALNGNEKNLTDKLFANICEAFPGVFNLDYLLTGKGDLVSFEEYIRNTEIGKMASMYPSYPMVTTPTPGSVSEEVAAKNEIIAAKDETIAGLKRELSTKDELLQTYKAQLADKDRIIAAMDDHIATLNSRVNELSNQLVSRNGDFAGFPLAVDIGDKQPEKVVQP